MGLRAWLRLAGSVVLVAGAMAAGCNRADPAGPSPPPADAGQPGSPDLALADSLLAEGAVLPERAEVVALSDRLAVASSKAGRTPEGARVALLAAKLRERLWRLDQKAPDAAEARELYGAAVDSGAGTPTSCEADLRRATLVGELSHDARASYRELYLARRRQTASSAAAENAALEGCRERLEEALGALGGVRPSGEAWLELERDGDRAADAQGRLLVGPSPTAATSSPSGSAAPSVASVSTGQGGQIVVAPDAKQLGTGPVELTKVQPFSWEHGARVVLTLSAPTTYQLGTVGPDSSAGRGHRVYLDVARARVRGVPLEVPAGGLIERVRLGKRPDGTRVVIDLAATAYQKVFYLPEPFRIVIDLGTRLPAEAGQMQSSGKRSVRRVSLDPGHGGEDTGAVGPTGLREKDVTLDIAHRAAPALAHELGVETMLTRDTDTYVFLEERTARANAFHADLFVSIHCNATEDGQARGLQLFVLDPSREMDAVAQRVAGRENALAASRSRFYDAQSLDAQVAAVAAGLNIGDLTQRSNRFSDLLRISTLASLEKRYPGTEDRGIKTAGFFVLVGAEMPAVLYETAFISNPADEALLATADYRQKLADAVVNAIQAYRDGR